ncbi:MAG: DUF3500 domain-containing protein [Thermoguttaceae bacterium]
MAGRWFCERFGLVAAALAAWLAPVVTRGHDVAAEMTQSAERFLKSLDQGQVAQVSIGFQADKRTAWHYIPSSQMASRGGRRGLALKDMSDQQRALAHGLLSTALSHRGYLQATTIMALEAILRDVENGNPARDPAMYHVAIHGKPSAHETWGWSVEGHHLSVNLTLVDGQRFCATPSFFGSNPAIVRDGPFEGLDTLEIEQKLGRALVQSLTAEQRKLAVISPDAPRDIITGAQPSVAPDMFQPPQGIPFEKLDERQQKMLGELVDTFTDRYRSEILQQLGEHARLVPGPGTHFAWAGGVEPGQGHYYRIQTPDFLFEYDNTQGNANHVHTVWRQFDGDFGADLLRQHYRTSPHHQPGT